MLNFEKITGQMIDQTPMKQFHKQARDIFNCVNSHVDTKKPKYIKFFVFRFMLLRVLKRSPKDQDPAVCRLEIENIGAAQYEKAPTTVISIEDMKVKALMDTGAEFSCIRPDLRENSVCILTVVNPSNILTFMVSRTKHSV
jgi:hypothetical protein